MPSRTAAAWCPRPAKGEVVSHNSHSGQWLYDGTNANRKYLLIDGKQPSAPVVPFAEFQLHFVLRLCGKGHRAQALGAI